MTQQPPQGPPEGWQQPQQPQWGPPPSPQQPGWGPPPGGQQPPPRQGPQGGWGAPPPQRPPNRKLSAGATVVLSLVGIVVVLGIIGALAGEDTAQQSSNDPGRGGGRPAETAPPETTPAEEPATTQAQPGLRDTVRDGKFEFVVKSFDCQGNTCKAQVTVENIGDEAQTMFADNQYLFDQRGRRFEADNLASSDALFLQELNPGLATSGTIVWRVPPNFKPDHLELHDSVFSGGVTVQL
jgi:hypothetical protein